jgi:mannose-6-phosphate isomerase-like protein (cupin superfamily)
VTAAALLGGPGLATLTGSSSANTATAAQTACKPGITGVHRYVIAAHNNGNSYTEFSNCAVPHKLAGGQRFGGSGPSSTILWATNQIPVDNSSTTDAAIKKATGLLVGKHSTSFSVFSFGTGKSFLHRTASIDYWIMLKGEVTVITDSGNITLHSGDVLINRGGDHAWYRKPGSSPALALTISISAKSRPGKGTLAGRGGTKTGGKGTR